MPFSQCENCRRFYNTARAHDCPAPPVVKKKYVYKWIRPWHKETAADRIIARKFRNCKSMAMFGDAA